MNADQSINIKRYKGYGEFKHPINYTPIKSHIMCLRFTFVFIILADIS